MTRITVEKNSPRTKIVVEGHSHEASSPTGNIVCAAVSMLVQTIANYIYNAEAYGQADVIDITLKDGYANIEYTTDNNDIKVGVDAILSGFELLADSYPDIITYKS